MWRREGRTSVDGSGKVITELTQFAIWLELFKISDKWNRFGTWQHLEINDPSQG